MFDIFFFFTKLFSSLIKRPNEKIDVTMFKKLKVCSINLKFHITAFSFPLLQ